MTDSPFGTQQTPLNVSVIIPTLNEAENVPLVLSRIPHWIYEVILVDGRSVDGTVEIASKTWPNHHIVREERRARNVGPRDGLPDRRARGVTLRLILEPRHGKGVALRSGFAAATGDIIVMLDADGSTDPAEIPAFLSALLDGADYAKGSRFLPGGGTIDMSLHRRLGNWGFVVLARLLFGARFTDLCYGYNAFWTPVAQALCLDGDGFEIETMMNIRAVQAGFTVVEVPSFEAERVHGIGRLRTFPDGWRVLKTIWREWSSPSIRKTVAPASRTPPALSSRSVSADTEKELVQ